MQTRSLLAGELEKIRQELAVMSARVETDLGKALTMMRSCDTALADELKASAKTVDALQLKIEDMALVFIATQQPVARDLREMIMVFKLTSNLERINDYGWHLVKTASKLAGRTGLSSIDRIERMAETGKQMLNAAFAAYLAQDIAAARAAALLDDIIDGEHKALIDEVLALMKENKKLVKPASRLLRLSASMERLGDHITNICEAIIYMVKGSHERLND
jgi:phosphate transport system protein